MNLKTWAAGLSQEKQEEFFKQAAHFLSNRELSDIISNIQSGLSLYQAHIKTGVFDRYIVDLENIKKKMQ